MNTDAFFSDGSEEYLTPAEPEADGIVTVRFRCAKTDRNRVYLVREDGHAFPMFREKDDSYFEYHVIRMELGSAPLRYWFRIEKEGEQCIYDRTGVCPEGKAERPFEIIPGFHVPEWAKGAVMYQIFVDRFCRGDKTNDVLDDEYIYIGLPVRHIPDWHETPSAFDVGYFYGGDLSGVREKLDYLKDLGVSVIYFNPLFVSPSNHKYDTQDYEHIDPHFGKIVKDKGNVLGPYEIDNRNATKYVCRTTDPENLEASDRFFAELVGEIHERGMPFNKWLDREKLYAGSGTYAPGAYESADSPYRSYFSFSKEARDDWPDNASYDGWWGNDTLPKLNYEGSTRLMNQILGIARKWLEPPYSIDGWRLDVAADLGHSAEFNHYFWREFRKTVKETNPDALILAEHYGDPSSWLNGKEWDTVMNYDAFMEPVSWFLTGMEKHSDRSEPALMGDGKTFWDTMRWNGSRLPMPSLLTAMNELSNHDHSRFLTRTNHMVGRLSTLGSERAERGVDVSVMRLAILLQMTWQGAPTIYYGDEAGVTGWTDPDSRRAYPWGMENHMLLDYHRYVNSLHNQSDALKRGALIPVLMAENVVCYGRVLGHEKMLTVIYTGGTPAELELPVWKIGVTPFDLIERVILTDSSTYNVGSMTYESEGGVLFLRAGGSIGALFRIT